MIKRYGLKNVIFTNGIPFEHLHALYESCMFVVSLSRFETFHRIALEAWSHKKPIVALDLGSATEHISSDRGILVSENPHDVAKALYTLLENDKLRSSLGINGYEFYRRYYSVDAYVSKLINAYNQVMKV